MPDLLWLPGAEHITAGTAGGSFLPGPARGVLHRTEGSSIEGAVGAYRARNFPPHLTVDIRKRRIAQHLSFNVAARALENKPGGVETNRLRAIQIEIVGFSADSPLDDDDDVRWFGREIIRPISAALGIRLVAPTFYGPNCGWTLATPSAPQRFTAKDWNAFNGWCSHQHVPEQGHWDTGAFKIGTALAAAAPDDDFLEELVAKMNDQQFAAFMEAVDTYNRTNNVQQNSKAVGHENDKMWQAEFERWTEANTSRTAKATEAAVAASAQTNALLAQVIAGQNALLAALKPKTGA